MHGSVLNTSETARLLMHGAVEYRKSQVLKKPRSRHRTRHRRRLGRPPPARRRRCSPRQCCWLGRGDLWVQKSTGNGETHTEKLRRELCGAIPCGPPEWQLLNIKNLSRSKADAHSQHTTITLQHCPTQCSRVPVATQSWGSMQAVLSQVGVRSPAQVSSCL